MRKIALLGSFLCMTACAHAAKSTAPVAPLTPEQAQAFDQGVDFVASVQGLEGRWREDWDRDLQTRVAAASMVALVTVRSLQTDTNPEQQMTHRLVVQVDRELLGKRDGKEVELAVREGQLGFTSVHENMGRLTDRQYVAYVKDGQDGASWHLSPASDEVVSETEAVINQLGRAPKQIPTERVIVRTN